MRHKTLKSFGSIVYQIRDPVSGKIIYVGKADNLAQRMLQHFTTVTKYKAAQRTGKNCLGR